MFFPIVARDPLRPQQRDVGAAALGKTPLHAEVGAEAHEKNALAALGNAVIRRVQKPAYHVVFRLVLLRRMVLLKARPVFLPAFAFLARKTGVRELQLNVFKIIRECLAQKTFHVFEDERLRAQSAHPPSRLREHIALIKMSAVLPAYRKWLARWPAGHDHHVAQLVVFEFPHIDFMQRPFLDGPHVVPLVFAKGLAGVVIPFDNRRMLKTGVRHADRQPASAGEEFNATHPETSLSRREAASHYLARTPKSSAPSNQP